MYVALSLNIFNILPPPFPLSPRTPTHGGDCKFPAFSWQAWIYQRMLIRAVHSRKWWDNRVLIARYAQLPVSNMTEDTIVCAADIMLSRVLEKSGHLLWVSDKPQV